MRTETEWAIRNLELAGLFNKNDMYGGMIGEAVQKLLETHQKEGHSGASHALTVELFKRVALGEALTMEWWNERFKAFNEFAVSSGGTPFTEADFEKYVSAKPKGGQAPRVHVVEHSALAACERELAEANAKLQRDIGSQAFDDVVKERDELAKEVERLKEALHCAAFDLECHGQIKAAMRYREESK